jgi:hypothetical protein
MLTDVEARRALSGRTLRYEVLAPVGSWLGCGDLRVLRVKPQADGDTAELQITLGYESYERPER